MGLIAVLLGHGGRIGALHGGKIWWVAPTYLIAKELWRDLCRACEPIMVDKSEMDHRIELPGGGSVSVRSADNPRSLVAIGLDGVVVDEAGMVHELAWKESLRPALVDRQGWGIFIGTPKGLNWFYDLFVAAGADDRQLWMRWQRPSSDNKLFPERELQEAMLDMGGRLFAQEHLAQFTNIEGAEFDPAYFENIWIDRWPAAAEIRLRVLTLDPSKGKTDKSDYSAFVKLALAYDGTMYCDANLERRDTRQIVDFGLQCAGQFQPHAFGIETNQFQEVLAENFVDRSRATGMTLPIWTMDNRVNKVTRVRATLTPYLARHEIKFLRSSHGARLLVDQLRSFPLGDYDDGPDALEMAVRLMRELHDAGGVVVDPIDTETPVWAM